MQNDNVIKPAKWVIILLHFSSLLGIFQLFSFMGYGFTLVDFFLSILYLSIIKQFFLGNRKFKIVDKKIALSIFLLIFAVIFSGIGLFLWASRESYIQFLKTFAHFSFVAMYGIIATVVEINYKTIFSVLRLFIYSSIIINLYAIYQLIARIYALPFAYLNITNVSFLTRDFDREVGEYTQVVLSFENFYRATSIFSEPSTLAWFNMYCLIILVIPLLSHNTSVLSKKWLLYVAISLSTIGLFLTFSLSGLLLVLFIVVAVVVIEKIKIIRIVSISLGIMALLYLTDIIQMNFTEVSIANLFYTRISGLLSDQTRGKQMTYGESAPDRIQSFENAINLFLDHPITGVGAGNTYYYPKSTKRFTHSSFFHLLAETGLVGIIAFLFLTFQFIKIAIYLNKYRYKFVQEKPELATLQSFAIYLTLLLFFSNYLTGSAIGNYGFWLEAGLIIIIYRQTVKELDISKELIKD